MLSQDEMINSPVAWFSVMEVETNRGNFERAAEAKRNLERLGVIIRFKGTIHRKLKKAEDVIGTKRRTILG